MPYRPRAPALFWFLRGTFERMQVQSCNRLWLHHKRIGKEGNMLSWQRNLSFFAVHVSLPCLVHPALLEKPKRPQFAWRFCGTRKATRSPERLCCTLVEYEIERLYYFQIHLRILAHFHLEIVLLLDDGVLLLSSNGGHPCWERAGSDHRFDLNTVVAFV